MDKKENLFPDHSLPFRIHDARGDLNSGYLHHHDCLEINYVLGGSGFNFIDGKRYEMSAGDIFLINNYAHHFAGQQNGLKMKVLYFSPDFVWDHTPETYSMIQAFYCRNLPNGNRFRLDPEHEHRFRSILETMQQEYQNQLPGFQLFLRSGLTELLAIIYRCFGFSQDSMQEYLAYERLKPVLAYIRQHLHEDLSLSRLSEHACMSRTYFCSYFRNAMGVNVSAYIEQVRIRNAQLLLTTTPDAITDIGLSCGYRSLSSFHAAFRKLCGITPGQFRSLHASGSKS